MSSNDAANFAGSIPEHYDSGLGPHIFAGFAADIARRVAARGPLRVLETAAGTGIVTRQLRNMLPLKATLLATDFNLPMLDVARKKFGPAERVEFRQADAAALPFPDGGFDAATCQFGVMFFPDKDKAYREIFGVLAPCGRYVFSVWDGERYNPFARIAHEVIGSFFPADPPQFYRVPFSYCQIDPIKESLLNTGFAEISIAIVRMETQINDFALFARGLVYGNPVIDQIRAQGGIDPARIVEAIVPALRRQFGADHGAMPLQAIPFSAAKLS